MTIKSRAAVAFGPNQPLPAPSGAFSGLARGPAAEDAGPRGRIDEPQRVAVRDPGHTVQDLQRRAHDFRADAVSLEYRDIECLSHSGASLLGQMVVNFLADTIEKLTRRFLMHT